MFSPRDEIYATNRDHQLSCWLVGLSVGRSVVELVGQLVGRSVHYSGNTFTISYLRQK